MPEYSGWIDNSDLFAYVMRKTGKKIRTRECESIYATNAGSIIVQGNGPYMIHAYGLDPDSGTQTNRILGIIIDDVASYSASLSYNATSQTGNTFLVGQYFFDQAPPTQPLLAANKIEFTASLQSFVRYAYSAYSLW